MPPSVYKKKYFTYYDFRGKKTQDCMIPGCGKVMDWDRSKIKLHFKKSHPGTNLRAYYNDYIKNKQVKYIFIVVN